MTTKPTSGKSVPELNRHIHELAIAFNVVLDVNLQITPNESIAGVLVVTGQRFVSIAPVRCEATYAIALHELGHAVAPNGMLNARALGDMSLLMVEEEAAWEWAYHQALIWSPSMERVREYGMSTYIEARDKHRLLEQSRRLREVQAEVESRARAESVNKWLRKIL